MTERKMHPAVKAWSGERMEEVRRLAAAYREQGMSEEEAEDRAVLDVRMTIRRSPPLDLP
jgi:hypothetical protein